MSFFEPLNIRDRKKNSSTKDVDCFGDRESMSCKFRPQNRRCGTIFSRKATKNVMFFNLRLALVFEGVQQQKEHSTVLGQKKGILKTP